MINPIKIAIIQFPGSNTERETVLAVERANMQPVEFLWNENHRELIDYDGYIIVGGFSYEDRSRAGIIASLDPVMNVVREQAEKGKPVLGICNGAQILVESGMVPGLINNQLGMALTNNKRTKDGHVLGTGYYNTWANLVLSAPNHRTAYTGNLDSGDVIYIPFAHAEGRFIIPQELLSEMIDNKQIVFRYGDKYKNIHPEFPTNPNGSDYNIAAVCNPCGNVMAIMPHPERTTNGDSIFSSMREYIANNHQFEYKELTFQPEEYTIVRQNSVSNNAIEWYVESIITDNEAVSVQNELDHLDIPVKIKKFGYWKIEHNGAEREQTENKIDTSGELYNSNKEKLIKFERQPNIKYYLVLPREDLVGRHKTEILKNHFDIENLKNIKNGIIWCIEPNQEEGKVAIQKALNTNIFFNPYSHNCYEI